MNFLNIFEDRVSGIFGAAQAPFSFKKLAKQAVREMEDQTMVINGADTAPALYTILIANEDDPLMAPYYPQLSREISEFVKAQADKKRYRFVGEPLVRFMIDPSLKAGRFSVFAENVDAPTLGHLYEEERAYQNGGKQAPAQPRVPQQAVPSPATAPAQPQAPSAAAAPAPSAGANVNLASQLPPLGDAVQAARPDPFAPNAFDPAVPAPIPVPQTVTRDALAGMGGAAATGAALGAASVAANMAGSRAQRAVARPLAQLADVVTGDLYEITSSTCTVGRERATADVVLRDPNVSRRHAQLIFTGSDWSIEDLNSTNGTLVNNRRISRCPLRDGDLLTFGLSTFEFRG